MGIKLDRYSTAEYYQQFVNTHTVAVNSLRLRTTAKGELNIEGFVIRKTTSTGSAVPVLLEVWELATPTTGGTAFSENPANSNREDNTLVNYTMVQNPTANLTGAKIMFRERGLAERTNQPRSFGINRNYALKPNTDYLIRSTVESGSDFNVESILIGRWIQF